MMSFEAFRAWVWGMFIWGWIGTGIIAVAAIWEVVNMLTKKSSANHSV